MKSACLLASALAVVLPAVASEALARPLPRRKTAVVLGVDAPLGAQRGGVAVGFRLFDPSRKATDVEVQYGYDVDGDGRITDGTESPFGAGAVPNEYFPATEDRSDPRNTRRNRAPQLFTTAADIGAAQAFVWKSSVDVGSIRLVSTRYQLTPQGRKISDGLGGFVLATGPDGDVVSAGVKIRMRAFTVAKRGRVRVASPWVYSRAFDLDSTGAPSMRIDGLSAAADKPTTVLVDWTAFHSDSEDLDGDGVLDAAQGEDKNGNGLLDSPRLAVAFDWHLLRAGEDPTRMSAAQLAALSWLPCTRDAAYGDTDSVETRVGVPLPTSGGLAGVATARPGVGRHAVFAWDTDAEFGRTSPTDGFILRATPTDQNGATGPTVYSTVVLHPGW
jgi:hypothetical protein